MFIAIPHSTTLQLGGRPYVTWSVMLICLLVHLIAPDSDTLKYYPESWNPITMLTASVAHADWGHIIFNLIFFYAFSPMLEMAIASIKRYLLTLVTIAFVTQIAYSLFSVITDDYVRTLGLSGVVTGVIGMSAYLIPRARVRTFVWFFVYARNHFIPAWLLAAWYIGGDIIDIYNYGLSTEINFISHISGGVTGYLIGYRYFKEHKKDIKDEVDDAIEYARSSRQDMGVASTYKGDRIRLENEIRERDAKRNHEQYMSQLYNYVQAKRDSDAIMLILKDYELKHHSIEIYEELYDRVLQWGSSRALLCLGRLVIDLHMQAGNYSRSIKFAKQCHAVVPDFVLADPLHVLVLAKHAVSVNENELALLIIQNTNERYGDSLNEVQCMLLEADILWLYLGKPEEARRLVADLLSRTLPDEHRVLTLSLARSMQ